VSVCTFTPTNPNPLKGISDEYAGKITRAVLHAAGQIRGLDLYAEAERLRRQLLDEAEQQARRRLILKELFHRPRVDLSAEDRLEDAKREAWRWAPEAPTPEPEPGPLADVVGYQPRHKKADQQRKSLGAWVRDAIVAIGRG
jgi:hypothetical protein